MTDAPAFFRAIEANPDDDTPRLVYADWLDENAASDSDRARAEFIRVQCERARDPEPARLLDLLARERELLHEHAKAWAALWECQFLRCEYVRGFLDPVHLPGPGFAWHAARLSELVPLYHVRLARVRGSLTAVAACPQLALVRRLTLAGSWARNADMTALATSSHLDHVQLLDLSENGIGIRGATDLTLAQVPALHELRLTRNPIKDRGLLALAQAAWPSLEHLDATECGLRYAPAALADGPLVCRLVSLQLSRNPQVPTSAWLRLAAAPMNRLERLDLSNPNVTDEVAKALAANPVLVSLRVLHLGAATITDRGAQAILASPSLRGLTRLRLPEGNLSAPVCEQLRAAYGDGFNPQS
jgi:uncharacterized protein (TIGR02996 family)